MKTFRSKTTTIQGNNINTPTKNSNQATSKHRLNQKTATVLTEETYDDENDSMSTNDHVPIRVVHAETIATNLSFDEYVKLEKEAKNQFNLGKLYSSADLPKSRDCLLRALGAREQLVGAILPDNLTHGQKKQVLPEHESMLELAMVIDKLAEVELKLDMKEEAKERFKNALQYYRSIPDPPASSKKAFGSDTLMKVQGKKTKKESKSESIQRLKKELSNLDPTFVDIDAEADTPVPTPQSSTPKKQENFNLSEIKEEKPAKTAVTPERNLDDDLQASIKEIFSVSSPSSAASDYTEEPPVEFPKIVCEDYHLGEIKFSESLYEEAKDYYLSSLQNNFLRIRNKSEDEKIIINILQERIGMCFALLKSYAMAKEHFNAALDNLSGKNSRMEQTLYFRIYIRLGHLELEHNQPEEAIKCYVNAFPTFVETKTTTMNEDLLRILLNCIYAHESIAKKARKRRNFTEGLLNYKVMLDLMKIYMAQGDVYKNFLKHDFIRIGKTIASSYIELEKFDIAFSFSKKFLKSINTAEAEIDKQDIRHIATIYHHMGILSERKGNYRPALLYYGKSLEMKRKIFTRPKDKKEKIGKTILYIAFAHYILDEDELALQYFKEAIDLFGMYDAKSSYDEYASVYQAVSTIHAKRDEIDDAIFYINQKVRLAERCDVGSSNGASLLNGGAQSNMKRDVAESYHNMGLLYSYRRLHLQSIDAYKKSYVIWKGLANQDEEMEFEKKIFSTMRNLASSYSYADLTEEALKCYQESLTYADEVFDRLSTYNKIGVLLCKMNRSANAMEFFSKALQEESSLTNFPGSSFLGGNSSEDENNKKKNMKLQMSILNNAGNCISETAEDSKTALEYYKKASTLTNSNNSVKSFDSSISSLGKSVIGVTYNMGMMYMKNQDYDNAVNCFLEFLDSKGYSSNQNINHLSLSNSISRKKMSTKEEDELYAKRQSMEEIAAVLNNIGNVKYNQGLYEDSIEFFQKSLKIKQALFGRNDPKLALTVSNLGTSYYHLKQYEDALKKLDFAMKLLNSTVTVDKGLDAALKIATLCNKMGNIYSKQKEFKLARVEYQKAYKMKKELLNDEYHPEVLLVRHNIALVHIRTGDLDEALMELQILLEKKVEALGEDSVAVAKLMVDLSGVYFLKKQLRDSRKLCEVAISKFKCAKLPQNHLYMRQAENTMKKIEKAQQWNFF